MAESFELKGEEYTLVRKLGQGTFGSVYLYKHNDEYVTLKLFVTREGKEDAEHEFTIERDVLQTIHDRLSGICHPNIACYMGDMIISPSNPLYSRFNTTDNKPLYGIFSKYIDGPSVLDLIDTDNFPSVEEARNFVTQMLDALSVLKQLGIAHRDIKPSNIVYDRQTNNYVLIDFGLACVQTCKDLPGTPGYVPIELDVLVYDTDEGATLKDYQNADIFALGITLYEYVTGGGYPFYFREGSNFYQPNTYMKLQTTDMAINIISNVMIQGFQQGLDYIKQLWEVQKKRRITSDYP